MLVITYLKNERRTLTKINIDINRRDQSNNNFEFSTSKDKIDVFPMSYQ